MKSHGFVSPSASLANAAVRVRQIINKITAGRKGTRLICLFASVEDLKKWFLVLYILIIILSLFLVPYIQKEEGQKVVHQRERGEEQQKRGRNLYCLIVNVPDSKLHTRRCGGARSTLNLWRPSFGTLDCWEP